MILFQIKDKSESTEQEFLFPVVKYLTVTYLMNVYFKVNIYNLCIYTKNTFRLLFTLTALS